MPTDQQTTTYYDTEAAVYDDNRYGDRRGRRADSFHKKVLSDCLLCDLAPGASVLELGCGTGRLTAYAAGMSLHLAGIDVSTGMLAVARSKLQVQGAYEVSLTTGTLTALPFSDNSFDAAYAILVLNLIPDLSLALSEAARVLKPGGILVFNLPNLGSLYGVGGLYVNLRGKTIGRNASGYRYSHWYTRGQVKTLLRKAGFELERSTGQPPLLRYRDAASPMGGHALGRLCSKSLYYKARLGRV